ncbi:MAG: glutamyl-tRNA reductase [Candidatus Omnitrophica bacterium]|nr:glutamyl-tRNA reductase [Candidatus Omnitrophota bacterium]MBU1128061.1 glutamyl-tRNA reductase [Candidatus Omnitrophota bacterium]MBU1851060.1 glutamyl-tRNA reductase [Candidatus Omnitrophota bacterium]
MDLIAVGTNHRYSPVELREKLFFTKGKLREELFRLLKGKTSLKGAVILSTCNRTEIYASAEDVPAGIAEVVDFLSESRKIDEGILCRHLYVYERKDAVRHLYEVCSGLNSLVVGELQIMGQVKYSLEEAEDAGLLDPLLKDVFRSAISVARRVHTETGISRGKVSVGSVAVDFIKRRMGTLSGKTILLIGVGKVTELVLRYLKEEKRSSVVFVSNRTYDKAKEMAERIGAQAVRFDNLREFLEKADIVITATASPHFVIKKETFQKRENRLLAIDLAVPRDIDPGAGDEEKVELFSMEDMEAIIEKNMDRKIKEAQKARNIIDREVEKSWEKFTKLEREPALLP